MTITVPAAINSDFCRLRRQTDLLLCSLQSDGRETERGPPVTSPLRQSVTKLREATRDSQYPIKVFSLRNWDELLTWLDELEAGMTDEHRAALTAVHP